MVRAQQIMRQKSSVFWDLNNTGCQINYKELFMVKVALEKLDEGLSNFTILLRIDNTTAMSYVNCMGGVKFEKYNELAHKIWQWAKKR